MGIELRVHRWNYLNNATEGNDYEDGSSLYFVDVSRHALKDQIARAGGSLESFVTLKTDYGPGVKWAPPPILNLVMEEERFISSKVNLVMCNVREDQCDSSEREVKSYCVDPGTN